MPSAPATLILFGATSDLAVQKIFPAIVALYAGHLDIRVIATGRRSWSSDDFRSFLADTGTYSADALARIEYVEVDFDTKHGYDHLCETLAETPEAERIFYLSLAPVFFATVVDDLREVGLLTRGDARVVFEKPFGTSELSARALNTHLMSFLDNTQLYRVDHYLGKATMQAVMRSHEASTGLRFILSNETVSAVRVELTETKGADGRASYDSVGAFRDVGQNHMLTMLAVVFAEYPQTTSVTAWQDARATVIESLRLPRKERNTVRRGQYVGYPDSSETETAFEISTEFDAGELAGVPVTFRGGKKLKCAYAGVTIEFAKRPEFPAELTFEIQPCPRAILRFHGQPDEIIDLASSHAAYEHVLNDALAANRRHFVGSREVIAAWHYTDRMMHCLRGVPLERYSDESPFFTT